jgi:hypothetical protein
MRHEFRPDAGGSNSSYNRQARLLAGRNQSQGRRHRRVDIVAHTATARGGFNVMIEPDKSGSVILTKAGIVEYYCRFHPNMTGRIAISPE